MGMEGAEGQPDERQAERARQHAQNRKRTLRQVRDARDRLTSTTGNKRSFDYELMRALRAEQALRRHRHRPHCRRHRWVAGWVTNPAMGAGAGLIVLIAHGFASSSPGPS